MSEDDIESLVREGHVVLLKPNDVLVYMTDRRLGVDQAQRVKEILGRYTRHEILVLADGGDLAVLRHEESIA